MTYEILVVNTESEALVHQFNASQEVIPAEGDHVWVPDNGDVAYQVNSRQFDYAANEVRLLCKPNPGKEKQ